MFKNLKIGLKLGIGFGIVIIVMLILGILTYRSIKEISRIVEMADDANRLVKLELESKGERKNFIIRGFTPGPNETVSAKQKFDDLLSQTFDLINELKEKTRSNEVKMNLSELESKIKEYQDAFHAVVKVSRFDANGNIIKDEEFNSANQRLILKGREALSTAEELRVLEKKIMLSTMSNAITLTIILIVAAVVIGIIVTIFITRKITIPIAELRDSTAEISRGDLTREVEINQKDELGQLADSFRGMQDNLRKQLQELTDGTNVISTSTNEIMATISQLSASASETAASVSETTTTIEEVRQTADSANQKAKHVAESGQKTASISQGGAKAIQDTIEGMNNIREQMASIADTVVNLSEQSQAIGEIINSVNDIAEQSNLLAVNAAIEAAKAGELGKGFAVVAQEIKNLAEQSKLSTTQVRSILSDIQKAISTAVMSTEQGSKAVEIGMKLSAEAGDSIDLLSDSILEAAQASTQIAASSQQQLVGMDQVASAMESIKEASLQTAASTKQTEGASQDLNDLGQRLQQMLKRYNIS